MSIFHVRCATPEDALVIARQHVGMLRDANHIADTVTDDSSLLDAVVPALQERLRSGQYYGWLALADELIIAGAGLLLRPRLPYLAPDGSVKTGYDAHIVNVYTVPEWRGRGAARMVMQVLLAWVEHQAVDRVTLHAAPMGESLYRSLGFVPVTNAMRWSPKQRTG